MDEWDLVLESPGRIAYRTPRRWEWYWSRDSKRVQQYDPTREETPPVSLILQRKQPGPMKGAAV